jgi:hypothetical protein
LFFLSALFSVCLPCLPSCQPLYPSTTQRSKELSLRTNLAMSSW